MTIQTLAKINHLVKSIPQDHQLYVPTLTTSIVNAVAFNCDWTHERTMEILMNPSAANLIVIAKNTELNEYEVKELCMIYQNCMNYKPK
jgi:hypothetical protein